MLFHITQGNMISKVAFSIIYLHLISKEKGILGIKEIKIAAGSRMDIPRKKIEYQNVAKYRYARLYERRNRHKESSSMFFIYVY